MRSIRLALCGAAIALMAGLPAAAHAVEYLSADSAAGFTAAAGITRDANGDIWVADSHAGLCRVRELHGPAEGALVPSAYCQPNPAFPRGGPVALTGFAHDPATDTMWVADGASGNGAVWRFRLGPGTDGHKIIAEPAERIISFALPLGGGDRVFGMTFKPGSVPGGGEALVFSTKDLDLLQWLRNPRTCVAITGCQTSANLNPNGSVVGGAVSSMAFDDFGKLYVTEGVGVGVIDYPGGAINTQLVPGLNGVYTSLAFDPVSDNGRLYAGTTNPEGTDRIDVVRLSDMTVRDYSDGFNAVTAMHVNALSTPVSHALDVADDPGISQAGEDVGGTGRRLVVPFEIFADRPVIVDGPVGVINRSSTTFAYTFTSDTNFFCSLDAGPLEPCGNGVRGQRMYDGLADGGHVFRVRADNTVTGTVAIRRFAVDTHAPVVSILPPVITGSSAELTFSADELNVNFMCRLDGSTPAPCDSPARYAGLKNGIHTFSVQASDFFGNQGPEGTQSFRIGPPPSPPWKPGKITATLRGRILTVNFLAPPGATVARFTVTKRPIYPVRTVFARVKAGKRNVVRIVLPRTAAQRLHTNRNRGKGSYRIRIDAGATRRRVAFAGTSTLRILAPLTKKAR